MLNYLYMILYLTFVLFMLKYTNKIKNTEPDKQKIIIIIRIN